MQVLTGGRSLPYRERRVQTSDSLLGARFEARELLRNQSRGDSPEWPHPDLVSVELWVARVGITDLTGVIGHGELDPLVEAPVPLLRHRHGGRNSLVRLLADRMEDPARVGDDLRLSAGRIVV